MIAEMSSILLDRVAKSCANVSPLGEQIAMSPLVATPEMPMERPCPEIEPLLVDDSQAEVSADDKCRQQLLNPQDDVEEFPWSASDFFVTRESRLLAKGTLDPHRVERKSVLRTIIRQEEVYLDQLGALRNASRVILADRKARHFGSKQQSTFIREAFGKVDGLLLLDERYLLDPLRQLEKQGTRALGSGDVFRRFIREARSAYLDYAIDYPDTALRVVQEAERDTDFRNLLGTISPASWDQCLKAPCERLLRLVGPMRRLQETWTCCDDEMESIGYAVEEVKAVARECAGALGEMHRLAKLRNLESNIVAPPDLVDLIRDLELGSADRSVVYEGVLAGTDRATRAWCEYYVLLLDHCLIVATAYPSVGGEQILYVDRPPVPMDQVGWQDIGGLSVADMAPFTCLWNVSKDTFAERELHPISITSIPETRMTLFAYTEEGRQAWRGKINEAKKLFESRKDPTVKSAWARFLRPWRPRSTKAAANGQIVQS